MTEDHDILLKELQNISIKGLTNMFDNETQLFCHRIIKTDSGIVRDGLSRRYTIITLLGLQHFEAQGNQSPINIKNALEVLLRNAAKIDNIGDLGLLIWLCALVMPERIDSIWSMLDIKNTLNNYKDARIGKTTELAWFLTGLSHIALTPIQNPEGLEELASRTYQFVKANYGGKGIFGHQNKTTMTGLIRGRIGSFADQVYPIYAFSKFSLSHDDHEARQITLDCAETICRLQGPLGQWWWHYDAITGKVTGKYPVYSVHQDGMAPMALFAIGEITGNDFNKPIHRGLDWITGNNELGMNMIDTTQNVIWRSFYQKNFRKYADEILSLTRLASDEKKYKDLIVLYECRPYHLGWLLYAFSDKIIPQGKF